MDPGDQKIRIQAPTPSTSLLASTSSESQPSLLDPLSAATSTLFTSSPIEQNVPLLATNAGNPASDAHTELNQQTHDYEAIDPYVVSLAQQRKQLGNPKTHDLWIVATRIFFPQIYLHFSLRLPGLYWARVDRIFRDAAQAIEELKAQLDQGSLKNDTVDDTASARGINHQIKVQTRRPPQRSNTIYSYNDQTEGPDDTVIGMKLVSEDGITKLKRSWGLFIDSLLREWKTLNLVSVLLLSAVIAILQVDAVSADFAIRTPALGSAICALMSLLYGCIYTIRFFDMKKVHRAMMWSQKAQQSALNQYWNQYWNPWVFLSLPVVWLTWSIMLFTTAIMTYVWRTDGRSGEDYQPISPHLILASRLVLTAIFVFGLVHLFLVIWTLVEWDHAKLDNNFRATVNKNKGEVNKTTLVNAGMNLHTGGTFTTDPLSYSSGSPLSNAEASTSSGGRSSTPTNESQTIYTSGPAGGSTLALPTIPILSTRLGTFFLSFIPTAWLNDNRTHNLGRLVDPNRTTAQTPRPVVAGSSTSVSRSPLPASLARRVSRVRTPVPEPPIPEETENAEASTRTFSTQKISKIFRSVPRDIDAVELETLSRSLFEKGAPPDPRSQEQRNRVEQLKDLGAIATTDLTESNKSEFVDNGPLQSEATHAKSIVASKAKSDGSVAQTAMQGVSDIPEMGVPLPGPSRTHAKETSRNLKTKQFGDSVARTPVLRIVNVSSFGDMSSSGSELSLVHDFTPKKDISQTLKTTLGADLLQDREAKSKAEVENDYEEMSTASAPFEEPSIETPTALVTSATASIQRYLAEQQASLVSRHRERSIIRLYHLYDKGQKPDIPPELVEDTPGILQTRSQLSNTPTNDYQRDAWEGILPRDEMRDQVSDVPTIYEDNALTQSPEEALSTNVKTRPDDISWTKARKEFYGLSKLPHDEMDGPILPQLLAGDLEQTHSSFVHPPIYLEADDESFGILLEELHYDYSQVSMLPKEGYFIIQWPTINLPSLPNQVTYLLNNPFQNRAKYYPWAMTPFKSELAEEYLRALLGEVKTGAKPHSFDRIDLCWQWPDCLFLSEDLLLVSLHHIGFASDGKEVWQPQFRLSSVIPTFLSEHNPIARVQREAILGDSSKSVPVELPVASSISAHKVPFFYYASRALVKSYGLSSNSVCLPQICNTPAALRRNQTRLYVPLFFKDADDQYGVPLSQIQLPQPMPSGYIIISLPYSKEVIGYGYHTLDQSDSDMQDFPLRDLVPWGNAPCDWLPPQMRSNPNIGTAIQTLFNAVHEKVEYPITHPDGSRMTASDLKIFSLHHVGYISGRWQVWQPDFVLSTELASCENFKMWREPEMQYISEGKNHPEGGGWGGGSSVELDVYFRRAGVRAVYDVHDQ